MKPTLIRDVHVVLNGEDHYATAYYTPGSPGQGPEAYDGPTPPDPDEVDIQRLQRDDKFVPAPDAGPDYETICDAIREAYWDGTKMDPDAARDADEDRRWT